MLFYFSGKLNCMDIVFIIYFVTFICKLYCNEIIYVIYFSGKLNCTEIVSVMRALGTTPTLLEINKELKKIGKSLFINCTTS